MNMRRVVVLQRHACLGFKITCRRIVAIGFGHAVQRPTRQAVEGIVAIRVGLAGKGIRDGLDVPNSIIRIAQVLQGRGTSRRAGLEILQAPAFRCPRVVGVIGLRVVAERAQVDATRRVVYRGGHVIAVTGQGIQQHTAIIAICDHFASLPAGATGVGHGERQVCGVIRPGSLECPCAGEGLAFRKHASACIITPRRGTGGVRHPRAATLAVDA